jgi:transposase
MLRQAKQDSSGSTTPTGQLGIALKDVTPGTPVAVEATGNWYWLAEEIEEAGLEPKLVHPRKAKLMMGLINKTDKLDVHGLNRLQRNKTLPVVWIPPKDLRDLRELTRTRMVLTAQRTRLKNRVLATLNKYGWTFSEFSDAFGRKARSELDRCVGTLPPQTAYVTRALLGQLDMTGAEILAMEKRIKILATTTETMSRLMTLPGIGFILSVVIALEVGDIGRFPTAEHLASYSGTTPRIHQSGDKTRFGRLRSDVNQYLKWAYVEAANSICLNQRFHSERHVTKLYKRIKARKDHPKAIGAVARHLAEATYHVWNKEEPYRDPSLNKGLSTGGVSAKPS